MANKDSFQKYLDAGVAFTNLTRARAEELVSDLVQSGEFRGDARAKVDELIERSRKSQEAMFAQVRQEVDRQLEHLGITNLEDLAKQVASVIGRTAEAGRAAAGGRGPTAKKATAKKSPAKKATAKKSTAKKSTAKKSTAKKSTAKKAAAKKSPAKKATAKKAAAKRSAATKRSSPRTAG
ncbi:MAG TPA: histone H1-like repetitive region-containing protein [Acidimicrobiales bacterium]|nr:histone H1-like repetitive region-containing protein [Acidimicrobiales bacterium]